MYKIDTLLSAFFLIVSVSVYSQTAPKYSNEFLSIGVGARAFGMSGSSVASTSDVTSAYWNPAALTRLKYPVNLGGMHAEYFYGIAQYEFLSLIAHKDNQSALGISFIRFGVDDIPNTLELIDENGNVRFDRIKSFSAADYAFLFSYARQLKLKGLSVGGNAKIIRRVAGSFADAWGFGIDLSAQYNFEGWQFGFMARDITGTFNSWTFNQEELAETFEMTGNRIPDKTTEVTLPKFILGGARYFKLGSQFSALPEINFEISTDGKRNVLLSGDPLSLDLRFGTEFGFRNLIFVRAGLGNFQREYDSDKSSHFTCQPNIGMGIAYKRFTIDYALTDLGDVSAAGYSHVFSLGYAIQQAKIK
jgi:hypothetical protein